VDHRVADKPGDALLAYGTHLRTDREERLQAIVACSEHGEWGQRNDSVYQELSAAKIPG
jgi:hypothetical protein